MEVITGLSIYVTEIMRQFKGTGPWISSVRRVRHVIIDDNIPAFSVDAHSIFIERPRMELLGVLITTLLPCGWAHLVMPSQGSCLQRDLVSDPLRHGCQPECTTVWQDSALRAGENC